MSWLDDILKQHENYESPMNFWYWSALTAISAVVKDNVWIDRYLYKLYPNVYTILYADSGLKKGPPISMAKQLVRAVGNTKIISGRSSIQGIIKELGMTETKPGGIVNTKAHGFICASELSASLVEDKAALDILTDLYDRIYNEGHYNSLLKMESFSLKDPTISLLGGINEAHADVMFTNKDIKGGYIGRSFIIHESQRNAINSLIDKPDFIIDYKEASEYLKELAKLRGPFAELTGTPAGSYFKNWYHEFINRIEEQKVKDPTGTLNRFSESVMKVAMLLSLARSPELVIKLEDMEQAVDKCEQLIGNVRKTTMGSGKSQWAQEKALIIDELMKRDNHMMTRTQLNKKYWMRASSTEWDDVMLSLEAAGIIRIETQGNQVVYVMPDEMVDEWYQHLKGRN